MENTFGAGTGDGEGGGIAWRSPERRVGDALGAALVDARRVGSGDIGRAGVGDAITRSRTGVMGGMILVGVGMASNKGPKVGLAEGPWLAAGSLELEATGGSGIVLDAVDAASSL